MLSNHENECDYNKTEYHKITILLPLEIQDNPGKSSHSHSKHYDHGLSKLDMILSRALYVAELDARCISQLLHSFTPIDQALVGKAGDKLTMTVGSAGIDAPNHLVSNKGRKCVALIVDLIKCVSPKNVQSSRIY